MANAGALNDHSYHQGLSFGDKMYPIGGEEELEMFQVLQENRKKQELIQKMMEQQHELRALQERQRQLLKAQQQYSELDYAAENELKEKLSRLQAAKSKITKLQDLIKVVQEAGDADVVSSHDKSGQKIVELGESFNDCSRPVNEKLDELNSVVRNLLRDIDQMEHLNASLEEEMQKSDHSDAKKQSQRDLIQNTEYSEERFYQNPALASPLPIVKVIGKKQDLERSIGYGEGVTQTSRSSTPSKSQYYIERHDVGNANVSQITPVKVSPREEVEQEVNESASALNWEMKRQQLLLQELSQRRAELEALIKESQGSEYNVAESIKEEEEPKEDVTSDIRPPMSLNETNIRNLIDNLRSSSLDGTTQKTTATWGSSSASSVSEMENQSFSVQDDRQVCDFSQQWMERSNQGTQTQFETSNEYEAYESFLDESYKQFGVDEHADEPWENVAFELWDALERNTKMLKILMDDQRSLSGLLQNTISVRNGFDGNSVSYGISPDFIIYQLDNCSAQIFACQKNITVLQQKLNKMQSDHPNVDLIYGLSRSFGWNTGHYEETNPMRYSARSMTRSPMYYQKPTNLQQFSPRANKQQASPQATVERKVNLNRSSKLPNAIVKEKQPEMNNNNKKVKTETVENLGNESASNPLFEGLRDTIYSEAAALISQNECRPHFLIELFRELQQLNSDYLRQHCLYVVRDIVSGYLTESPRARKSIRKTGGLCEEVGNYSENTPSESMVQSDDNNGPSMPTTGATLRYDYALDVSSGSELSTPIPSIDDDATNPFATDYLGSTVVYLDEAMQKVREMERMKQEEKEPTNTNVGNRDYVSRVERLNKIDAKRIDTCIKGIMAKIIPMMKNNEEICTMDKMKELCSYIVGLFEVEYFGRVTSQGLTWENLPDQFRIQLTTILLDCTGKYLGLSLDQIGEDLVIDVSEVLFNELAFALMMKEMSRRKEEDEGARKEIDDSSSDSSNSGDDSDKDSVKSDATKSSENNLSSLSEEESVADENVAGNTDSVVVDLSVSETKPLTSYGSGEDEEMGSGEEYEYNEAEVSTSIQQAAMQKAGFLASSNQGNVSNLAQGDVPTLSHKDSIPLPTQFVEVSNEEEKEKDELEEKEEEEYTSDNEKENVETPEINDKQVEE
uniref:pericentriolar material 1 protein isoform X2 n=1 Tax=Ciona intestinalis TaxID=7719 RepID=UPI00089DCCFC|nr:pericentriolar material 1 protein isoform X2 [Ciona intestinalis]|eukprot:XP_018669611.1 pericentriolar material 1 protein isoform X2 [Ciona intestinalis]